MNSLKSIRLVIPTMVLSLFLGQGLIFGSGAEHPEHPEHPKKEHPKKEHPKKEHPKKEHPEHPTSKKKKEPVTLEDVAKAAEAYIAANSKSGSFEVYDRAAKKTLSLTLDKIHRDRLSNTKKDEYFVCADLKTPDGKVYDLDLFIRGASKDTLKIDKRSITVHKEEGKERYTWEHNEKKNVWVKKTIKKKKKAEHPKKEHPKKKKEHPEHP